MNNPNNGMAPSTGKGMSITALVLGILSIVTFWIPALNTIAFIASIVALVLGILGSKKAKAAGAPTGLATAGLVLAIIGLVFATIGFLTCTVCSCICGGGCASAGCAAESALSDLDDLEDILNGYYY